jgi:hypothetical protein
VRELVSAAEEEAVVSPGLTSLTTIWLSLEMGACSITLRFSTGIDLVFSMVMYLVNV